MQNAGPLQSQALGPGQSSIHSHGQPAPFGSGSSLIEMEPGYIPRPGGLEVAGVSASWRKLLVQAEMAAPHVQVASIEGESGVGKETLARYLLSRSRLAGAGFHRQDARQWLLEDSDFGSLKGFSYLDRVDLLAAPGQGLLLAVLKNLQDHAPGRAMLVASSENSLRQMAGQGNLLPDLAFRLTAVRFMIPPLRTRREDIAPIAQALLERICARYQHRPVSLSPAALGRLLQHSWPGNVRELASVLEAALLEASGNLIRPEDLAINSTIEPGTQVLPPCRPDGLALDDVIHRHVQYVLDLNHGNKLRASRQLRISRSTLYRILEGNRNGDQR